MLCPTCNTQAAAYDSRPTPDNRRRRVYHCPKCPTRFSTLEEIVIINNPPGGSNLIETFEERRTRLIKERICAKLMTVLEDA